MAKVNLKKILEIDLKTLIILGLIILILFMKMCSPKPEQSKIIKVDGKKYEVIKHIKDTQYIPQIKTVYKKGETIYLEKPVYYEIPQYFDTNEIVNDYYSKKIYKDTISLDDSLGSVSIIDTIQENKLKGRIFTSNLNKIVIKDSIIVKELPKNQVYFGGNLGIDTKGGFNYFGPNFLLKTKSDQIYNLGIGINNNRSFTIMGGIYWKIKLKK